ncbi:2-dehydropantoate 2-reductase [Cellulophaga sp. HaHaR_3_176]|uniref:ketopantoate reductase family protein n=1 Tax=Cellulophaga sp. HaHaR_3_176 TaxID=1942464 RepID=UPI001C1F27D5|nr:2-dehydropantoate 2-reductase [Cellulophaga sp. HaHaR_3_176]QWX83628.1 2-dehydropantoate 2-reductase [Cellulophaga sp. HaHaR_3_176]
MNRKHIVIIGLGGVGGYFGFKINQTNEINKEHEISFIARDKTYNQVKENGLTLLSSEHKNTVTHPDAIYEHISEIENPDLILICVKEYDLERVCKQLFNIITDKTVLLPMMNGADIYDRIRAILPQTVVLPSCVYVASHIEEKGIVNHKGKPGKLIFGKDSEHKSENLDWILKLLETSKIDFEFKENALTAIWSKFIFIASFGLVSANHNSSIGAVCTDVSQKEEATKIMLEIKAIADKKSIFLADDIIQKTFEKAGTFPPKTPTSLQLDVHSGKNKTELELFAAAIINYGIALDISTLFTESIYSRIKANHKNLL